VVAVVFLYQITFLQQNTTASLLELYFNGSVQTVYARSGGGSQQREVADGAAVFTDTGYNPVGNLDTQDSSVCDNKSTQRITKCRHRSYSTKGEWHFWY